MRQIMCWVLIIVLFASCAKSSDSSFPLDGAYDGVYLRTGEIRDSGQVTLVFAGSGFSGASTGTRLPICNGTYQVFSDSINFMNLCSVPDSLLLLAGKYQMMTVGDSLYFTRKYSGVESYEDHFNLKHR